MSFLTFKNKMWLTYEGNSGTQMITSSMIIIIIIKVWPKNEEKRNFSITIIVRQVSSFRLKHSEQVKQ